MTLKLEVGKTYLDRAGRRVKVTGRRHITFTIEGNGTSDCYTDGRQYSSSKESDQDLICEAPEIEQQPVRSVSAALAASYDLNGKDVTLSEHGADIEHISGAKQVTGYELAARISIAKRRIAALNKGIAGCEKLLEANQEAT